MPPGSSKGQAGRPGNATSEETRRTSKEWCLPLHFLRINVKKAFDLVAQASLAQAIADKLHGVKFMWEAHLWVDLYSRIKASRYKRRIGPIQYLDERSQTGLVRQPSGYRANYRRCATGNLDLEAPPEPTSQSATHERDRVQNKAGHTIARSCKGSQTTWQPTSSAGTWTHMQEKPATYTARRVNKC